MGTEQSYPIGTVLTRKTPLGDDRDELRVVGGGKTLVVTSNKGFSENFPLDAATARNEYTTDIPDSVMIAQPTYVDPGPTPEQVLSAADPNTERVPSASAWRPRKSEDPRTELESGRVDTGIPVVTHGTLSNGGGEEVQPESPQVTDTPVEDVEKAAPPKRGTRGKGAPKK